MVAVADSDQVNGVAFAEIIDAGHDVLRFFRLAVDGNVVFGTDLGGQLLGLHIRSGKQVVRPLALHGGRTLQGAHEGVVIHAVAECAVGVDHGGFQSVQQVHLAAGLLSQRGGKVEYGCTICQKVCCCQYLHRWAL